MSDSVILFSIVRQDSLSMGILQARIPKWVISAKKRCSCELSFIWGKMRTVGQEIASQLPLRKCSEEVAGRSVYL